MRRDPDFMRDILFEFEKLDLEWFNTAFVEGPEKEQYGFHMRLLVDAGLMDRSEQGNFRITNSGHDFIEAVRSENRWNNAKSVAAEVGGVTISMLSEIALGYLKSEIKSKFGIET